jgi:hypothetical protein
VNTIEYTSARFSLNDHCPDFSPCLINFAHRLSCLVVGFHLVGCLEACRVGSVAWKAGALGL